jgi:DNA mismatch repair protein MutS2
MTFATTHYSELKTFAISTSGIENASCEFNVETLKPTYRLLIGIPGKSNAFAISRKLGLSDSIIQRAKDFVSSEDTNFEDIIATVEKNRANSQKQLEEVESLRSDIEKQRAEIEKQRDELTNQKQKLIREAHEKAYYILEKAKEEADETIKEIQLLSQEEVSERNKKAEHIRIKLRKKLKETEESLVQPLINVNPGKKPYKFNIGDTVYISSLGQEGTILALPDESNSILVQAGIMKVKINASQLKPIRQDKVSIGKLGISKALSNRKTITVSTEIDLRGQALDEALENTDKYLDDVSLSGLKLVTLIHGKGTGVLKNGIHQFLRRHPHVKSFRPGKYGEGEQGVTIVELN